MIPVIGMLLLAGPCLAQDDPVGPVEPVEPVGPVEPVELPGKRELSAALAEPTSRTDAMLTLIAVARMLEAGSPSDTSPAPVLIEAFRDDRAWLDRLAARYSYLPARGTILDPAAWFVQQELGQHQIRPPHEIAPLGPGFTALSTQMFDRSDERLAAAFLPETLFLVETMAIPVWHRFLERIASSEEFARVAAELHADWFDPWMAAEPPAPLRGQLAAEPIADALDSLRVMTGSVTLPEPPDILRVKRLRFQVYEALSGFEPHEIRTVAQVLHLASGVDRLYEDRYLEFTQALLWVVTDLLDLYATDPGASSAVPQLIADFLPRLSVAMSRQFNDVDPRLNASIAAAFDVVQELADSELSVSRLARLQEELADAVAQLVLLVPDLAFYFDQPVRRQLSEEIDICISVAAARDAEDRQMFTRQQFDGCVNSMVDMVDALLRGSELSGDSRGPYGPDQLRRELDLVPWQRINYLLGYLHEVAPAICPVPERPLPNPIDWSVLASLLSWFAAEAPVFLQTPANEALVSRMQQRGVEMMRAMSRQVDCFSGSGTGVKDPVSESLKQYRGALDELVRGIREVEIAFRKTRLRPGADVVLGGTVTQRTAYRTPDLAIGPCDTERTCEMTQTVEATRALVGLFPDEYLIADQTGLGQVEICYDDMEWIERRSEFVRPESPKVSNYYGRLSFKLLGRYREGSRVENIFGSRFVSPEEYHYLIAATDPEVLIDGCPTEWVGTRIVTSRGGSKGFKLVPDRLTYLAAARSRPAEVILANWGRGAEWRDWFVTGIGVRPLHFEPDPGLRDRLARHLRALYEAEQQAVYSGLLRPPARSTRPAGIPLHDLLGEVTTYKSLLRALVVLLYPDATLDSDEIRTMLEGQIGLLDESVIRRFRSTNVPVGQIHDAGIERVQRFQAIWGRQPVTVLRSGSVATSVAHAMARLNALSRTHFAAAAVNERVEEVRADF